MQVLVLGMHRSGTSAVTRLLNLSGAYFGSDADATEANDENPKGFWERRDVRAVCDGILHAHGLDWWKVAEAAPGAFSEETSAEFVKRFRAIVGDLDHHRPWVIKEPRLCLVAPVLLPTLDAPVCVHVTRDPVEVASSLRRRNGLPLVVGAALWERYTTSAIAAAAGLPYVHVRYEDVVTDAMAAVTALVDGLTRAGVDGLTTPDAATVGDFVSPDLHRQRRDPAARSGVLNAQQSALAAAVDDGTAFHGAWDTVEISEAAADVLADHERRVATEQHRADELADARRAATQQRAHAARAAEDAEERRRDDEKEITALGARVGELEARATAGAGQLDELEGRLRGVASSRPWRMASGLHRLVRRLRGRERFDFDHLDKAAREVGEIRATLAADRPAATGSPSWASVERLPSGRLLRHSRPPSEPTGRPKLAVLAWDVGHNPLGRAYTMAATMADRFDVEIWGAQFARYGTLPWEPLRNADIPLHVFDGAELPDHFDAMSEVAERIDADILWVSKPRLPSLALGALAKRHRNRPLVVDVDDHELAFFDVDTSLTLDQLDALDDAELALPFERAWTRTCDEMIEHADLVTVSNAALQQRFGGLVVPHARDGDVFDPDRHDRVATRAALGIGPDTFLLLFGGTPRVHKGVLRVLHALEQLDDDRFRLALFGTKELRELGELDRFRRWIVTIPPRPFDQLAAVVGAADCTCVLQDPAHPVSRYQLPAKISDALAMGVPTLVVPVPPLQPLIDAGAVVAVDDTTPLHEQLRSLCDDRDALAAVARRGREYFETHLSYDAVADTVEPAVTALLADPPPMAPALDRLLDAVARTRRPDPSAAIPHHPARQPGSRRRDADSGEQYDLVMFWKQNDTGIYGRRSDMLLEYLRRSGRFRTILHFDSPITPGQLKRLYQESRGTDDQRRFVANQTLRRVLHRADHDGVIARTFVHSGRGGRRFRQSTRSAYPDHVRSVMESAGVGDRFTVFWVWPRNDDFPAIADALHPDLVVADVVDDNRTWYEPDDPQLEMVEQNYREVLARSDVVLANCEPVVDSMSDFVDRVHLIPNGCELPDDPDRRPPRPDILRRLPAGPVCGYVGNLSSRIDIDLLDELARRRPGWQLVMIGSTHLDPSILRLDTHPNVHFLGVRPYNEVKTIVPHFDVAMIPHVDNEMTRSMNPLKAFVYAAAGVPIVSTPVANLSELAELVTIADGVEEFESAVADAIAVGRQPVRLDILAPHSWTARADRIIALVDEASGATAPRSTGGD